MDALGKRLIEDKAKIAALRYDAECFEQLAKANRREADELERIMELSRRQR